MASGTAPSRPPSGGAMPAAAPAAAGEGLSTDSIQMRRPGTGAARAHRASRGLAGGSPERRMQRQGDMFFSSIYSSDFDNAKVRDAMFAARTLPRPTEKFGTPDPSPAAVVERLADCPAGVTQVRGIADTPGRGTARVDGNLAYLDQNLTTLGTPLGREPPAVAPKVGVLLPRGGEARAVYAAPAFAATRLTGGGGPAAPYGPKEGTSVAPWHRAAQRTGELPWERPSRIRTEKEHLARREAGLEAVVPAVAAASDLAGADAAGEAAAAARLDAAARAQAALAASRPGTPRLEDLRPATPPSPVPDKPADDRARLASSRVSLPRGEMNRKPPRPFDPLRPPAHDHLPSAHLPPRGPGETLRGALPAAGGWAGHPGLFPGEAAAPAGPGSADRVAAWVAEHAGGAPAGLGGTMARLAAEGAATEAMFSRPGTGASASVAMRRTEAPGPALPGGRGTPAVGQRPGTAGSRPGTGAPRPASPAPDEGGIKRPPTRSRPLNESTAGRAHRGTHRPASARSLEGPPRPGTVSRPGTAQHAAALARAGSPVVRHDVAAVSWRASNRWLHPAYVNGFMEALPAGAAGDAAAAAGLANRTQTLRLDEGAPRPATVGSRLSTPPMDAIPEGEPLAPPEAAAAGKPPGSAASDASDASVPVELGTMGLRTHLGNASRGLHEGPAPHGTWQEDRRATHSIVADLAQGVPARPGRTPPGAWGRTYRERYDAHDRRHLWAGGMPGTGAIPPRDLAAEEGAVHEYNDLVRLLRDRLHSHGRLSFLQPFEMAGAATGTTVGFGQLRRALEAMNLGGVSDASVLALMGQLGAPPGGGLDYRHLADALGWDRVPFREPPLRVTRRRAGPDAFAPFGGSALPPGTVPFGTAPDADARVAAMGADVARRVLALDAAFAARDARGTGRVTRDQFAQALREVGERAGLQLTPTELWNAADQADVLGDGSVDYARFLVDYAGLGGRVVLPEFLKPKAARGSTLRPPWLIGDD